MKLITQFPRAYLCTTFVDFRKSIIGLTALIASELHLSPVTGDLFVFMGRKKDQIRLVYFDTTGFAMWIKKLENQKFPWKKFTSNEPSEITTQDLDLLLRGIDIFHIRPHQKVDFNIFF